MEWFEGRCALYTWIAMGLHEKGCWEENGWNGLLWGGTRIGLNPNKIPNMIVCLHLLQNKR